MQIGTYLTKQISSNTYTFNSVGSKGVVELRIIISKDDQQESIYYNLAFVVWNRILNDIDDTIELRNGDMDRILATVANTAMLFMKTHPQSLLYIQGSNSIRTRKYQMGISKYANSIPPNLGILGLLDENLLNGSAPAWKWEHFKTGTNYHAFLLYTK
ncbi:DUF6934 family protein [Dyadobacter frigoris]|uniref:Uncharacterized protein n=1 Tax=Dyadobacter frigoris TaxID=2576211 RepID=A0A4V6BJV4_9BACT|nr:hypothetical protein [Dyadobacter frigoris]TKT88523.1 hypothetical protein FDK13_26595 [Dyadobacter frigoris]GLU54569.1 hypothetical protein Dfri01_40300 [Dyadobacter frigoris]